MSLQFNKWLERLLEEKEIDAEATAFEFIDDDNTYHYMPLGVIIEYIKHCDPAIHQQIRMQLVKIDFHNGDITHFFKDIGKWIAQNHKPNIFSHQPQISQQKGDERTG